MLSFWVKVTRNNNSEIISLYSPDFGIEILERIGKLSIGEDYRALVISSFLNLELAANITPKSYEQIKLPKLSTPMQHWERFDINLKKRAGFFSKILPAIGHIANILTISTYAFITFMSLRLDNDKNKKADSDSANLMGITGAILGSSVTMVVYIYSDASVVLSEIGENIDRWWQKKRQNENELLMPRPRVKKSNNHCLMNCVTILVLSGVTANTIITGITLYKQFVLVTDKYLELFSDLTDNELDHDKTLILWLIVNINILTWAYSNLAFQSGFAAKFIIYVAEKAQKRELAFSPDPESLDFEQETLLFNFSRNKPQEFTLQDTMSNKPLPGKQHRSALSI